MGRLKILNLTEEGFIRLWSRTQGSVAERARGMATMLGCSDRTVLREAERLGLQLKDNKERPRCECGEPKSPAAQLCRSCWHIELRQRMQA